MHELIRSTYSNLKSNEQALIELLFVQGFSVLDIPQLNLTDVIISNNCDVALFLFNKKIMWVTGKSFEILNRFIKNRINNELEKHDNTPLFVGQSGKRITLSEIWVITRKLSDLVSLTFKNETNINLRLQNETINANCKSPLTIKSYEHFSNQFFVEYIKPEDIDHNDVMEWLKKYSVEKSL